MKPSGHLPPAFWASLALAPKAALLLDYDGTLAPFREERDRAFPAPGVRRTLADLADTDTLLAIVSGRPAREVAELLHLAHPLEIWGCHGAERLNENGTLYRPTLEPCQKRLLKDGVHMARALFPENLLELKATSVAAHGRPLTPPDWITLREALREAWRQLEPSGLAETLDFEEGLELRLTGWNKGKVIQHFLRETGEEGLVAFAGDDDTDEDAFRTLAGKGLGILVRNAPRESLATVRLEKTAELVDFMDRWTRERRRRQA